MTETQDQTFNNSSTAVTNGNGETFVEQVAFPQETIASFTTSKGSVYTYDEYGHTTRFKTKTGTEQPMQGIAVFIEVGAKDLRNIASAYLLRSSTETTRIDVVEQLPDGTLQAIYDIQQVTNPHALQVATFRGDRLVKSKPASLFPKEGLHVFDLRRYEENGITKTERHLGHKVIAITTK